MVYFILLSLSISFLYASHSNQRSKICLDLLQNKRLMSKLMEFFLGGYLYESNHVWK